MEISSKTSEGRSHGFSECEPDLKINVRSRDDLWTQVDGSLVLLREKTPLTARQIKDLKQAVGEMGANAIEWGHGGNSESSVQIACWIRPNAVRVTVTDPGLGFDHGIVNRLTLARGSEYSALFNESASFRRGWGYGILLAMALVDEFFYNDRGNQVTLIKRFEPNLG